MAYLVAIEPPTCIKCERVASHRLFTNRNEQIGAFCPNHAGVAWKQQNESEAR